MSIRPILLFLFLAFGFHSYAQDNAAALEKMFSDDLPDTTQMNILEDLVGLEWKTDLRKALSHSKKFLSLAVRSGNDSKIALASNLMAGTYYFMGDTKNALLYNLKTLQVRMKKKPDGTTVGSKKSIASSYINTAQLYLSTGNYTRAIQFDLEALRLKEEIKDSIGIARVLSNLANAYETIENYGKCVEFNERALQVAQALGDRSIEGSCYNNLGNVYAKLEKDDKSLKAYDKAIQLRKEINDEEGLYVTYNNVGSFLFKKKNFIEAKKYYDLAWTFVEHSKDPNLRASMLVNLGQVYKHLKDWSKAEGLLKEAVTISQQNQLVLLEKEAYESLAQMFFSTKNFEKAYHYMRCYAALTDTVFQVERSKQVAELQAKYDDAYKTSQLEHLNQLKIAAELKDSRQEVEIQKQRNFRNIFLVGIILLSLAGFLIYNRYQLKNKLNHQLEEQNKQIATKNIDITNSITYAKRIQHAILPSIKSIQNLFPDNFVLYRPKDIVAGDFYWCEQLGSKKFIAVADCTGHGVPGAMVSVVCSNALDRVLFEFKITEPGKMMDKARELIVETFSKSDQQVNDGMDISILCCDDQEISWTGANNSLAYIHEGTLREVKSHKQPIGKSLINTPFPTHVIPFTKGDTFYLFTDGYADQFGGKEGKKLKYKNMLERFSQYSDLTMEQQKEKLDQYFEQWKGNLEQVDDVCVIGIRF